MYALAIGKWTWTQLLRQPWFWLWSALAFASWPIITTLTPLGIVSEASSDSSALYEVAFIGALLGCMQGLHTLESVRWLVVHRSETQRMAVTLSVLISSAALTTLIALTPALLLGQHQLVLSQPTHLIASLLHTCALGALLSALPLPTSSRALALPLVAWVLPSIAASHELLGPWTSYLFDAHSRLDSFASETLSKGSGWKLSWGPIIGWPSLAMLCHRPSRILHALRDPR